MLLHRWPGLVLGLLLVVETTSGAILLYQSEYFRATHSGAYHHTASADPIAPQQALQIVSAEHPKFGASWVSIDHGIYAVGNASYEKQWFVDPGTGNINGRSGTDGGVMGLLVNIHDCAFSCAGYPLYASWLAEPVWAGGPTFLTGITWGGLILGVLGLLMILLVLTSVKIWWPGRKRLRQRAVVRTGKGRFARDYDLHNVIGALALPFLLMWGVTGAALEFPVVEKAWLAVTGGDQPADESFDLTPHQAAKSAPLIGVPAATEVATRAVPGTVTFIGVPDGDADFYEIDIVSSYASDKYRALYSGDTYVLVDPHDATHFTVVEEGKGPLANRFYDKFLEPTHFGWNVNGWWRLIWFGLGMAPLALLVTGVSTWLYRRGIRKRRRKAGQEKLSDATLDPDHLGRDGEPALASVDPGADPGAGPDAGGTGRDSDEVTGGFRTGSP